MALDNAAAHTVWLGCAPRPGDPFLTRKDIALGHALAVLHPTAADHPVLPLTSAFNWRAVAGHLEAALEGEWYIVVFRSVRRHDADRTLLYAADAQAHAEALASGGLLLYF